MAAGLPNSDRDAAEAPSASDRDADAVENFFFEASAGVRGDAPVDSSSVPPRKARHARGKSPRRGDAEHVSPDPVSEPEEPLPDILSGTPASAATVQPERQPKAASRGRAGMVHQQSRGRQTPSTTKRTRRKIPPWAMSLGFHVIVLVVLSFATLATLEPDEFLLWADAPAIEQVDEFHDLKIESDLEFEEVQETMPTELEDPGMAALGELATESVFADMSSDGPLSSDSLGDWGSMFGDNGTGLSELDLGQGNALTTFFGTKSAARDVVFVIDNTGSMSSGGLETVIVELMSTIDQLDSQQQFYVLFFSDQVYPLFFPNSVSSFIRPTPQNKQKLVQWLDTVEFCTGGVWQLTQALDAAYQLQPDVIYLLCDGRDWDRVRASYKVKAVQQLRNETNAAGIPVHTLGMGCKTDFDRENLAQVARVNSGVFREVAVSPAMIEVANSPAMIEVANSKNRPYHGSSPGTVWGTLVPRRSKTSQ